MQRTTRQEVAAKSWHRVSWTSVIYCCRSFGFQRSRQSPCENVLVDRHYFSYLSVEFFCVRGDDKSNKIFVKNAKPPPLVFKGRKTRSIRTERHFGWMVVTRCGLFIDRSLTRLSQQVFGRRGQKCGLLAWLMNCDLMAICHLPDKLAISKDQTCNHLAVICCRWSCRFDSTRVCPFFF